MRTSDGGWGGFVSLALHAHHLADGEAALEAEGLVGAQVVGAGGAEGRDDLGAADDGHPPDQDRPAPQQGPCR